LDREQSAISTELMDIEEKDATVQATEAATQLK
jgi:hypothetical protein